MDVKHPGSQKDVASNWEPAHSFVEDTISGAETAAAPCLPDLAVTHLPLCPRGGVRDRGLYTASYLSFGIPSILCSVSGPGCKVESFMGTFSFLFFLSGDPSVWVAISHSSLRMSTGHSGPILTLSTDAAGTSLSSPQSLVADASIWANSQLAVEIRCVVYGFFVVVLPPPPHGSVALWYSKTPQRPACERFSQCGNFSIMTSSPGWVCVPNSFVSFCLLYFVLPPFKENGLPLWVPGVLRQHSEVVLWKLLSIQRIFR